MSAKKTAVDAATGEVVDIDAARHLSDAFVRYALMVSRSRAVPDVRDGLKPVQRRILWAAKSVCWDEKTKCARLVGEVMGKYHPHGDMAIYDALVRLAQDWTMRVPLLVPQGNFGSPNGDDAAAQRYTETRLSRLAREEILTDLDKESVDFKPNYDDRETEPTVLPVSFPHLLVNGSSGIAVALKTDVPPHNLEEVTDATLTLLDDPETTVDQIMRKLRGPDFPTGGLLLPDENFRAMYATGKGSYLVQARIDTEQLANGRAALVVKETLYATRRDETLERIGQAVQDQQIEGIVAIRDESAQGKTRCVIELRKDADPERVLRQLLAMRTLGLRQRNLFDMTVVVDGVPRTLGIKQVLQHWIDFRVETVRRRSTYLLARLREQDHLLEGLAKALGAIDRVIATIKKSRFAADAAVALQDKAFGFSAKQAEHVVQMQLGRLASLEQEKIHAELARIRQEIAFHENVLAKREAVRDIIRADLERVKTTYGDPRRTRVITDAAESGLLSMDQVVPDEDVVLTVNRKGFAKRYRAEVLAKRTGERDAQDDVVCVGTLNARDQMYLFTALGKSYLFKAARFPEARATERGAALEALVQMDKGDSAVAVMATDAAQFVFFTDQGEVKRVDASDFVNAHAGGILALTLNQGDRVIAVSPCSDRSLLAVASEQGQVLRFKASEVRLSGRGSGTVRAITLKKKGDRIVGAYAGSADSYLVTVTDSGFAKRTRLSEVPSQGRGTTGIRAMNFGGRSHKVAAVLGAEEGDLVLLRTKPEGDPRVVPLAKIVAQPRDRAGQRLLPSECHGGVAWTGQARLRASGANGK